MNKKRFLAFIILPLLALSLFSSFVSAAAASNIATCPGTGYFEKMYCLWLGGITGVGDFNLSGELIKWLMLILIVILVFSILKYVDFPPSKKEGEGTVMKLFLAIVIGVLATIFITTEELITIMQSYTALGIAIAIFIPILILAFFTLMVATKASPFGIFLQKILWVVYGFYVLFKTLTLWILIQCKVPATGSACSSAFINFLKDYIVTPLTSQSTLDALEKTKAGYDSTILVILIIVSIFVLFMTLGNKFMVHWFAKEKMLAEIEGRRDTIKRSDARDRINAESMESQR